VERHRLVIHAERHIGGVLPEFLLHLDTPSPAAAVGLRDELAVTAVSSNHGASRQQETTRPRISEISHHAEGAGPRFAARRAAAAVA
jgi:hypothetical protein